MALIDTETLLAGITEAAPCGEDLEYDAAFMQLERSARGASQDRLVGPEAPGDEPDWRAIRDQSLALLARTKDLRVSTVLVKALLRTDGLLGFAAGVQLMRALLERYWDAIHPALNPEDDYNPLMRTNALRELCDYREVLGVLRVAELVSLPGMGSFCWKDLALASGELKPVADEAAPDPGKIEAAFANCDAAMLERTAEAVARALADVRAIEGFVTEKVGLTHAISLEPLHAMLGRIDGVLRSRVAQRRGNGSAGANASTAGNGVDVLAAAELQGAALGAGSRAPALAHVASRADVVRALDLICAYYEQNEPSSPVPILLQRAKRLVAMNFLEIVRDLAPSGAPEIETLRGRQDTE